MRNPIKLLSLVILAGVSLCSAAPVLPADAAPPAEPVIVPAPVLPQSGQPSVAPHSSPAPLAVSPVAVQVRIGYVDLNRVGTESRPGKEAQARFTEKADKLQSKLASRQKQLEKQKVELQTALPTLAPEKRAARIKAYEKKVEDFKKSVQTAEKEMQPLQEELFGSLSRRVEQSAKTYGTANGLAAVLVKKDMLFQGGNVTLVDVTDEIIKLLDTEGAK